MIRRKQRWKVHQCETCERWTSSGVMVAAGRRPHRYFKWVCDDCQRTSDNLRAVEHALNAWEIARGYQAS